MPNISQEETYHFTFPKNADMFVVYIFGGLILILFVEYTS